MASENAQERPTRPAPAPALPSRPSGGVVDPEARLKQRGTLTVLVKEAKNLKGRDADGLSNPYVAIKVKNHKTWKSQVGGGMQCSFVGQRARFAAPRVRHARESG